MPLPASLPSARRLIRVAAVLVPVGVGANVAFSLLTTDRELLDALWHLPALPFVATVALSAVPWITQSLRIVIWTGFVGCGLSFPQALKVYAGGVLGSAVTPTAVGGGSIRWALATRAGVPVGTAASLLSVEGVEDTLFFLLALPAAMYLSSASEGDAIRRLSSEYVFEPSSPTAAALAVLVALGVAVYLASRLALRGQFGPRPRRRARRWAVRVRRPLRSVAADVRRVFGLVARRGKGRFALSFTLTAIQWTARYSVATLVIAMLGGPLRPYLFWVLGWLTYAIASPVPTPGAAVATEATFLVLHEPFVPPAILTLATSTWRLVLFYLPAAAAAALFPLLRTSLEAPPREPAAEIPDAPPDPR